MHIISFSDFFSSWHLPEIIGKPGSNALSTGTNTISVLKKLRRYPLFYSMPLHNLLLPCPISNFIFSLMFEGHLVKNGIGRILTIALHVSLWEQLCVKHRS